MIKVSDFLHKDLKTRLKRFHRTNHLLKIAQPGTGLGLQVFLAGHAGGGVIDKKALEEYLSKKGSVENLGINKPGGHVFWTSTLKDKQSAWLEWCSYEMPEWIGNQAAIIRPGGKVFHIKDMTSYEYLYSEFPLKEDPYGSHTFMGRNQRNLDWPAVAKEWDGIHMTEDAVWSTRDFTYGWDMESTAWLNPTVLTIERIVDVERQCSICDEEDDEWMSRRYGDKYTLGTEE